MLKKNDFKAKLMLVVHKFTRYTKQQKTFVLYLFGLTFCLIFFPLIKVDAISGGGGSKFLISGSLFRTMLIVFVSLAVLIGWNMSFRFKNMVINYLGFKEHDALVNFALLWVIATSFMGIGDAIKVVNDVTSTVKLSGTYYFTQLYILGGLVLTLISVIKAAKANGGKTKIINMVDDDALKEVTAKKSFKGLFDEQDGENE